MHKNKTEDKSLLEFDELHVAKCYWELRREEVYLIESRDKMTVTRALYQYQTFLDNKTNVEDYLTTMRSELNGIEPLDDEGKKKFLEEDMNYTPELEEKYAGIKLLSQYKLSQTRE